jgi:hypothetical protein
MGTGVYVAASTAARNPAEIWRAPHHEYIERPMPIPGRTLQDCGT